MIQWARGPARTAERPALLTAVDAIGGKDAGALRAAVETAVPGGGRR